MKTLTRDELKSLAQVEGELCFSFYLKTAWAGRETLENAIRFRRLIREAHEHLLHAGIKQFEADRLLAPAVELLDDYPFWRNQERGLAIFLSDGALRAYKIPYEVATLMVDGAGFHLKPLLPLLAYDGNYFILALSQNSVSLFRASRYLIEEIPLPDVPQTQSEALRFDNPEKSLHVYTARAGSRGDATAVVHGQGAIKEDAKERLLQFFYKINHALHAQLKDEHMPLLLAAVEYYLPIYRKANTYPYLVDDIIPGNPEFRSPEDLREAGWKKLAPLFRKARLQAADAIQAGLKKHHATDDLEEAVIAASHGRVAKCLVSLDEHCWGSVDEPHARISRLDRDDRSALDLLDYAAVQTVLHGGDVFPVSNGDRMPGDSPLAVLYRF